MLNPTTTRECFQHAQGMFDFSSPKQEEFESGICLHIGNRWTHVDIADVTGNSLPEFPGECACSQNSRSSMPKN